MRESTLLPIILRISTRVTGAFPRVTTTPRAHTASVIKALGALENGKINPDRLLEARGTPIAFTFDQFQSPDGVWHPVLRFAAVIPRIIPMQPEQRFGWSRPEIMPANLPIQH